MVVERKWVSGGTAKRMHKYAACMQARQAVYFQVPMIGT